MVKKVVFGTMFVVALFGLVIVFLRPYKYPLDGIGFWNLFGALCCVAPGGIYLGFKFSELLKKLKK